MFDINGTVSVKYSSFCYRDVLSLRQFVGQPRRLICNGLPLEFLMGFFGIGVFDLLVKLGLWFTSLFKRLSHFVLLHKITYIHAYKCEFLNHCVL